MRRQSFFLVILAFITFYFISLIGVNPSVSAIEQKVYDDAGLLTESQITELENLANTLGAERETDFIILTTNDTGGQYIREYMADFYDNMGPGYDRRHGNTAILALDMKERDVYLAGFYKAETYLDNTRIDKILDDITPYLSEGDYYMAFESYIKLAHEWMGYEPGYNPDNIFYQWWFQLAVALIVPAIVVGMMLMNSGGRITVSERTYMNSKTSRVLSKKDDYLRTMVSKQRKPSENKSGGGGMTGGGHSFSGGGRKF